MTPSDAELDALVAWLNDGRPAHGGTQHAKIADAIAALRRELAEERRACAEMRAECGQAADLLAEGVRHDERLAAQRDAAEVRLADAVRALQSIADGAREPNVVASEALDRIIPCNVRGEGEGGGR